MKEFPLHIDNRKVVNSKELKEVFDNLKDGRYLITIKDLRSRSLNQNAYYWGVIVPMVKDGLINAGYDIANKDEVHEVLKHFHLKRFIVSNQTGDMIDFTASTSKLTPYEFNEYIERICRWTAEYLNVVIPSPTSQINDYKEWKDSICG